jgi:multidrug efflux pump subunit AcrA (membrane-fusion protein)
MLKTTIHCVVMLAAAALGTLAHAGQPLVCLIQPSKIAEVGTSVIGVIESLNVERGDTVRKGQVIAVLRNDVERAAQALDKARSEEQVAVQRLAQAREQRQIWERERSLAQSQLAQRTIVSPFSGIVAERYLTTGERIEERSVARIVSIDPLYVEVMVPAAHFGKVKTGMTATVSPELPGTAPVQARVSLVDKIVDGASNTFRVRLTLPNPKQELPAGLRCKADLGLEPVLSAGNAFKPVSYRSSSPLPSQTISYK